jgi:hypothetical protein
MPYTGSQNLTARSPTDLWTGQYDNHYPIRYPHTMNLASCRNIEALEPMQPTDVGKKWINFDY